MELPGERLLARLWETIENSGVGLVRPWQLKRVGMAETQVASQRMLAIAAAEKQIEKLRQSDPRKVELLPAAANQSDGASSAKIEPALDVEFLTRSFTASQTKEFLRKEVNIEKAIAHAEGLIQSDAGEPSEQAVDIDWFFRWREYAGGVTSEALQQLWGNVLAGELKAPGSFAYRTLDFLRNLTQEEARLIERLAAVVIEDMKLVHGRTFLQSKADSCVTSPFHDGELMMLEELGILTGIPTLGFMDEQKPFHSLSGEYTHLLACKGRGILAITDSPEKVTQLGFYRVTKLGINVLKLVQATPDEEHLLSVGYWLIQNGFKVKIGSVIDNGNGTRRFEQSDDVALPNEGALQSI
jgi:hypothetical protein